MNLPLPSRFGWSTVWQNVAHPDLAGIARDKFACPMSHSLVARNGSVGKSRVDDVTTNEQVTDYVRLDCRALTCLSVAITDRNKVHKLKCSGSVVTPV